MTAKDFGLQLANRLGSFTGLFDRIYQDGALDHFSPEEQHAELVKYRLSIGLSEDILLPSADSFNQYEQERMQTVDNFEKVTVSGKTLAAALNESTDPDAQQVKKDIDNALALTQGTRNAKAAYEEELALLDEKLFKDTKIVFHPGDLVRTLKIVHDAAHKAIVEQHTAEKTALKRLFENNDFKAKLISSTGSTMTPTQVDAMKGKMLSALEASQKKELAAFDKSIEEPTKKMHDAAAIEMRRLSYLLSLYNSSQEMKEKIEKLHRENLKKSGQKAGIKLSGEKTRDTMSALFKDISVKDLGTIKSVTGRELQPAGNGAFSMEFPSNYFNLHNYYNSSHNNVKQDMLVIAGAVYASGYESITMTIDQPRNKEQAEELGRQAYIACLETGFPADQIEINVNGKVMKTDDLFREHSGLLQAAQAKAAKFKEARENEDGISDELTTTEFRNVLRTGRAVNEVEPAETRSPPMPIAGF